MAANEAQRNNEHVRMIQQFAMMTTNQPGQPRTDYKSRQVVVRSQSLSLRQHNIGHRRNNGYLLGAEAAGADPVPDMAVATNADQRKVLRSPLSGGIR